MTNNWLKVKKERQFVRDGVTAATVGYRLRQEVLNVPSTKDVVKRPNIFGVKTAALCQGVVEVR